MSRTVSIGRRQWWLSAAACARRAGRAAGWLADWLVGVGVGPLLGSARLTAPAAAPPTKVTLLPAAPPRLLCCLPATRTTRCSLPPTSNAEERQSLITASHAGRCACLVIARRPRPGSVSGLVIAAVVVCVGCRTAPAPAPAPLGARLMGSEPGGTWGFLSLWACFGCRRRLRLLFGPVLQKAAPSPGLRFNARCRRVGRMATRREACGRYDVCTNAMRRISTQ